MPSFLKEALVLTDEQRIELKYTKYVDGKGYEEFSDSFETRAVGNWTHILSSKVSMRYEQFLDTMLEKTTETRRVIALIELDNILCENKNIRSILRIMNAVKILDPTFNTPYINVSCGWQKKFVKNMCTDTIPEVIKTCANDRRLEIFFNVLRLIESEI